MPLASGVAKQLRYKFETTWGVIPSAGGAQLLRRVTSGLNLKKETYESDEITSTYQRFAYEHGVRSVEGPITGKLSPGTYKDFMQAAVRRDFTTVAAITGASITVAGAGPTYTITRAAGSWIADGIRKNYVGRLTAGSFNAANLNKNLLVLAETATVLTVVPINGVALVAEGPIAAATWTTPGKVTFAPASGHTDKSVAFEHWHSDVTMSEVYSGCKLNQLDLGLPATGLGDVSMSFLGKDVTTAGAAYYTSPTVETTSGIVQAVNGVFAVAGSQILVLNGMKVSLKSEMNAEPVVGQNTYAGITPGRILVEGDFTSLLQDGTIRDYFYNATEINIVAVLPTSNLAAADFVMVQLPRVKLGDAAKDDGPKTIVQSSPFTALYNGAGTSETEITTIGFQDSLA